MNASRGMKILKMIYPRGEKEEVQVLVKSVNEDSAKIKWVEESRTTVATHGRNTPKIFPHSSMIKNRLH